MRRAIDAAARARSGSPPTSSTTTPAATAIADALARRGAARRGGARGGRRLRLDRPRCTRVRALAGRRRRAAGGVPPARPLVGLAAARRSCAGCTRSCASSTSEVAFVGGINLIDDRHDLNHGWTDAPRLDFAVRAARPAGGVGARHGARDVGARATSGATGATRCGALARSARPVADDAAPCCANCAARAPAAPARRSAARRCARPSWCATTCASAAPSSAATSRPSAARATRVDIAVPVLLPGPRLPPRAAPRGAARRARAPAAAGQDRLPHRRAGGARAVRRAARRTACASSSTRRPSCTPRWRWSTTTGPPWAAPTSTRCRCCSTWRPTWWCATPDFAQRAGRSASTPPSRSRSRSRPRRCTPGWRGWLQRGAGGLGGGALPARGRHHRPLLTRGRACRRRGSSPKRLRPARAAQEAVVHQHPQPADHRHQHVQQPTSR